VHLQRQERVPVGRLCLVQLWTVFGLASNADYKNNASSESWVAATTKNISKNPAKAFTYETVQTSFGLGSETGKFFRTIRILPRDPSHDLHNVLPAKFIFSDDATFYLSSKVNRHNVHVWGMQNSVTLEHERDSPKENVFCAFHRRGLWPHLFFRGKYRHRYLVPTSRCAYLMAFVPVGRGF
jgi:hypothetical protein